MSKLTVIGDPHVKNNNLDKANKLFDIIEELGNPVLLLGDVLDTKEVIRGKSFNLVYKRIMESKLHFIILVGNHDYFNLECLDHSLQPFKQLSNVTIVDEPLNVGLNVQAIPYIHDRQKFREIVAKYGKKDTVFMHQGFSGFDYGNGFIAEGESELSEISHIGKVISGHFHKYQASGNLIYLGTPMSHSFGESNQDKYIGVFDTETKEMELYSSPFPQHLTIQLQAGAPLDVQLQALDPVGNHLRFIVEGSQADLLSYNKAYLQGLSEVEVKIIEKPTDEFMNGITIEETADNAAQFQTWAKDIKNLESDVINLGLQILGAVNVK